MAAPPEVTCANLSGKFSMNKSLSEGVDAMCELQGLAWLVRKTIDIASVVLTIKSYTQDSQKYIDVTTVVAGLSSTKESRTMNWELADHDDKIYGKCRHKSRLVKLGGSGGFDMAGPGSADDAAFLRGEKLADDKTESRFLDEDVHVQTFAENVSGAGWKAEQVWGFETVAGQRRYTRRVVVWNEGKTQWTRVVYDYKGEGKKE